MSQESLLDTPVSEALGTAAVAELFDSILHEVRDEVNVPAKHLSDPTLLGFIRNTTSAGRPSAVFHSESACWVHTMRRLSHRKCVHGNSCVCVVGGASACAMGGGRCRGGRVHAYPARGSAGRARWLCARRN